MFQNLLFNNIKNESHTVELIFDFVYVFESARIKCVYAITHMCTHISFICEIYPTTLTNIGQCRCKRKLSQTNQNILRFFFNKSLVELHVLRKGQ